MIGARICASQRMSHFFAISGPGNSRELKQTSIPMLTAGVCWSKYDLHQSVLASWYLSSWSTCFVMQHETAGVASGVVTRVEQTTSVLSTIVVRRINEWWGLCVDLTIY